MAIAVDTFATNQLGLESPAVHAATITPHDTNELAFVSRGLMAITTAGIITVVTLAGDTVTVYLPLGVVVPIRVRIIKSTSAVAAGIVSLW